MVFYVNFSYLKIFLSCLCCCQCSPFSPQRQSCSSVVFDACKSTLAYRSRNKLNRVSYSHNGRQKHKAVGKKSIKKIKTFGKANLYSIFIFSVQSPHPVKLIFHNCLPLLIFPLLKEKYPRHESIRRQSSLDQPSLFVIP